MRISIIGAGYVGLVTGACLAKLGNDVTLIDTDEDRIRLVSKKEPPIYEEGLDVLLEEVQINATTDYQYMRESAAVFLCVGTPVDEDGNISLEQIKRASEEVSKFLIGRRDYCLITVKSTIVPATTEEVVIPILEKSGGKAGRDFGVCMAPEFLREGKAIYDFMNPMRLIIGEFDNRSGDKLMEIFQNFDCPIQRTDLRTAEMIKLASNSFLATKISFINEIGNICKHLGIDTYEVATGMGFDNRIGKNFLNSGLGFGGSCLPKDIRMLMAKARELGYQPRILEEVSKLNEEQGFRFLELLKKTIKLEGSSVGLLGLAFKPGTDDIRESRAIVITQELLKKGVRIKAYDPLAMQNFKAMFPEIEYVPKEDVLNCDAILILTEWEEFNNLDYTGKIVIDGRKIPSAQKARIYQGICW